MLKGFSPPYTPTGKSSLMPAPPWHYAGQIMSFDCDIDAQIAAQYLPDDFGTATGKSYGHFCDWQATSDGSELLDPIYAQYKEFFYLIEAEKNGEKRLFCPFIYVDQDIALARGHLQGFPKKHGSIWMTRSYDFDHPAAAQIKSGCKMGASMAAKDRRLADAEIELTGETGEDIGFIATPTFGLIGSPSLIDKPSCGTQTLVRQNASEILKGKMHAAKGHLRLHTSPYDELHKLQPTRTNKASIGEFALTVIGVTVAEN